MKNEQVIQPKNPKNKFMNIRKGSVNKILMFLLLAYSGNPFFRIGSDIGQVIFVVITLLLAVKFIRYFDYGISKYFYVYIFIFVTLFFFQYQTLGFVTIPGSLGFLIKITFGYLIINYIGINFKHTYLNVIYFISIISLGGYTLNIFGIHIPATIYEGGTIKSIILFSQSGDGLRNSGMFWEPGAFACYINLLFLLYLGYNRKLLQKSRLKVSIILIALITTFSTTGYLVFFCIVLTTLVFEYGKKYNILVLPILLIVAWSGHYIYNNSDFLSDKVEGQFEQAFEHQQTGEFKPARFSALLFDLHYILKNPILGNGLHEKTRYADHPWLMNQTLAHGNGFSNFIASMGLFSFIFYSFLIIKFNRNHPWIFLLGIIGLLQGEQLLNFPLFLSLPFIFIYEYHYCRVNDVLQQKRKNFKVLISSV